MNKAYIKEIFTSIQGEGLYVGEPQIFIRFCSCNLNCSYCDTDFIKDKKTVEYTASDLASLILHDEVSTVSLTGGEPLLETDFLMEFLPLIKPQKRIYLETNGTLTNELMKVIKFIDVIASDIKLESATKQSNHFDINDEFLNVAKEKECFIKLVFDENIKKQEISQVVRLAKKHNLPLILQPKMNKNNFCCDKKEILKITKIFYSVYPKIRLIPQIHKFLKIM